MAITGTLVADFSSFYEATEKAEASLKSMDKAANQTGRMLDAMVDGFDTAPVVADVDAVDQALKNVGATAAGTTSPALDAVGGSAGGAAAEAMTFKESFSQVDKTLATVGINLGPIPTMLDQMTGALGKSVGQLGLLATVSAAAAVGIGAFKVTRLVAELTGLDEKVGNLINKFTGWGDVAKEEAAAGAETLARASKVAGHEITNMDVAIRVLTEGAKANAVEQKKMAEELEKGQEEAKKFAEFTAKLFSRDDLARANDYLVALGGVENVTKLTVEKKKELNTAVNAALAAYTALGEQAPADLRKVSAATFDLSAAMKTLNEKDLPPLTGLLENLEKQITSYDTSTKGLAKTWKDVGGVSLAELEKIAKAAQDKYDIALGASEHFTGKQIADFRAAAAAAKAAVDAWGTDTLEAYDAIAAASSKTADTQIADADRAAKATQLSWSQAMDAVRQGQGTMTGTVTADLSPAGKMATQKAWDEGRYYGPVKNGTPTNPRGTGPDFDALGYRAAGGPVAAGQPYMVGEQGRELFVPSTPGAILPHGTRPAAGAITVNISTVMGNAQEIARLVSSALVDAARSRGERLPMGV